MQGSLQRIQMGAIFFLMTIALAVVGYMVFGWTVLEAVYMVVITIFGVGYGEVKPLETPAQKIFTIVVIIAGTSSAVYLVGGFVQMLTEGEINRALHAQRKQRSIDTLNNHTIICGFGRIGQVLARQLAQTGELFVVVDTQSDRIQQAEDLGYLTYTGNASEELSLQSVGISTAKVLATVLPDDANNVFIALTARGLNPNLLILARGELPSTEKKLRLAGADHVVLPAALSGIRMASLITRPTTVDFFAQAEERRQLDEMLNHIDVQLDELVVEPDSSLAQKSIREIEVRSKGTFIIVALQRADGTVAVHPNPSLVLNVGDTLIILGHQSDIPQFARHAELKNKRRYRGATF
ncbi:potassium channel protein [Spirulina major CS-329]|uniref:potassium channel family protein n=1 Tax=Spirulina TaxID=1154 RepID=UPI002330C0C8|nr:MULTISPECIES: potassium channel protein [Spirulina]MDB9496231.1 potassium channel protein [Spirulina subsalsa CS-330]MDB9502248.1 potassium channel protein [Spirulina major CS-329]